jgi:branched-chain amino acid transport system ATP-binding protein
MSAVESKATQWFDDVVLNGEHITKRFGGLTAVDVDEIAIPRNRITALIGPNGAGKTTLFNQLTGFDKPDTGKWWFNGKPMHGKSAPNVARGGMVRTFQQARVFTRLTVLENVLAAASSHPGNRLTLAPFSFAWRKAEREFTERAWEVLRQVGMDAKARDKAAALSGGQRKLLELARALMLDPEMLMLDEPMAGVNPALAEELLEHIRGFRDAGKTVLFVEHDMDAVGRISDHVICMAEGKIIATGSAAEVGNNQSVIDAYLGRRATLGGEA